MIRLLCWLFLFAATVGISLAQLPMNQQQYGDSLYAVLRQTTSDSVKAKVNYLLSNYWLSKDTLKARQCLEEGRKLSAKHPFLQAVSYAYEGYFYYASDMDKSELAYRKADSLLSRFTTKEAYVARSNIWVNCAAIQQRKDDDRAYTDIVLNRAIPLSLLAGDSVLVSSQYVGLGVAFMNTKQYEKAEVYFNKAIPILITKNTQPSRLIAAYNRAGENYIYLQKYEKARLILDTLKEMLAPYPKSELNAGYYLVNGMYLNHLKQYDQAVNSYDQGIRSAGGPNKIYIIQELLFLKTKALIASRKYDEAKQVLTELSKDEEVLELDNNRLEIYSGLAETAAGTGNMDQAFHWQKQYSRLSDSIHEGTMIRDINALEIKYQKAQNQKEIIALKAKNEQAVLSANNNRLMTWLLASVSFFLFIIALFALLYYRNNKKLLLQKEHNHQQQLKDIEQQQQLQYGEAVLLGEEQERRRLARDLHDGLGGMLAGVKINLSGQATETVAQNHRDELQKIIGQVDHSLTELRRIAHNMMPVNLLKFGLQTAIQDLCELLMTASTRIDFQAYGIEKNIPEQTQINIYRIVQELLANTIRHAEATSIILQCIQNGDTFLITLEDNGKGFDVNSKKNEKGTGLSNIRNRVGFLKGTMEINSIINEGTAINIELHAG